MFSMFLRDIYIYRQAYRYVLTGLQVCTNISIYIYTYVFFRFHQSFCRHCSDHTGSRNDKSNGRSSVSVHHPPAIVVP